MLNELLENRIRVSQQVWEGRAGLPGRKELVRLNLLTTVLHILPVFFRG